MCILSPYSPIGLYLQSFTELRSVPSFLVFPSQIRFKIHDHNMQLSLSLSFLAALGMASAAAECERNGFYNGPFANNKNLNAPNDVGATTPFVWNGNTIMVKMQAKRDSCDPEGDCDDDITYNFKNQGKVRIRARIEESKNDHLEIILPPGADCDVGRYFNRYDAPYQVSFAQ